MSNGAEGVGDGAQQCRPDEYRWDEQSKDQSRAPEMPGRADVAEQKTDVGERKEQGGAAATPDADRARDAYNARVAADLQGVEVPSGTAGETVATAVGFMGGLTEIAGEAIEKAAGLGMEVGGLGVHMAAEGYHLVKAIGETHDANAREAKLLGAQHAIAVATYDVEHASVSHVGTGTAYSSQEMSGRTEPLLDQAHRSGQTAFLQVENTKEFQKQYDEGRDLVVGYLNEALRSGDTPAERLRAMNGFVESASNAISVHRREWAEVARARTGTGGR